MKKQVKTPKKAVKKTEVETPKINIVSTASVVVKPKGPPTRYKWLFEQLKGLKSGQTVVLDTPKPETAKSFRNRIYVVLQRAIKNGHLPKAPGLLVQITADDNVAISVAAK